MTHNGRVLQCVDCKEFKRFFEATLGARTDKEHEYLEELGPITCGACLEKRCVAKKAAA